MRMGRLSTMDFFATWEKKEHKRSMSWEAQCIHEIHNSLRKRRDNMKAIKTCERKWKLIVIKHIPS